MGLVPWSLTGLCYRSVKTWPQRASLKTEIRHLKLVQNRGKKPLFELVGWAGQGEISVVRLVRGRRYPGFIIDSLLGLSVLWFVNWKKRLTAIYRVVIRT